MFYFVYWTIRCENTIRLHPPISMYKRLSLWKPNRWTDNIPDQGLHWVLGQTSQLLEEQKWVNFVKKKQLEWTSRKPVNTLKTFITDRTHPLWPGLMTDGFRTEGTQHPTHQWWAASRSWMKHRHDEYGISSNVPAHKTNLCRSQGGQSFNRRHRRRPPFDLWIFVFICVAYTCQQS